MSLISAVATSPIELRVSVDTALDPETTCFELKPLDLPAITPKVLEVDACDGLLLLRLDQEMTPDVSYLLRLLPLGSGEVRVRGFRPHEPPGRRFRLWEMLPRHNRRTDHTGDLRRFISCLQEVTDLLLADLDRFPDIFDLERAPDPYLDLILQDLGNPFPFDLELHEKRRLASVLVQMYRQKGTAIGIINTVRFFMDLEVKAILPYAEEGLVLGESLLGEDWILGPSARFARYAFDVEMASELNDTQREQLRAIVEYLKPAHTHFVRLLEPSEQLEAEEWRLGIGELGQHTILCQA